MLLRHDVIEEREREVASVSKLANNHVYVHETLLTAHHGD